MKIKKHTKIPIATIIIFFSVSLFFILLFSQKNHDTQDIRTKAQSTTINPATAEFPSKLFAPYVDVTLNPLYDFEGAYNATGQKFYTFAFIGSIGGCYPAWAETLLSANPTRFYDQLNFLRSKGGDAIISFGGYTIGHSQKELSQTCATVQEAQSAYQQVITQYKIRWIDMDIEGTSIADTASVDKRNKTLAALQAANPGLKVSYTLPVFPTGLTPEALNLLSNAKSNGVNITVINIMTMDYNLSTLPDTATKMGDYAIDAINNTRTQVSGLGITTSYGITPMIGQNDMVAEKFLLADAPKIVTAANAASNITFLSMWSSARDTGGCPDQTTVANNCSGILQSTYDFTKAFYPFTSPSGNQPVLPTFFCVGGGTNCIPSQPLQPSQTINLISPPPQITIPSGTQLPKPSTTIIAPSSSPVQPNPNPFTQQPKSFLEFIWLIIMWFLRLFQR